MVEKDIEPKIFSSDFQRNLAADESESHAQLDEELSQVRQQFPFEVAFVCFLREGEEIEVVGVFDELLCEVRLRRWESRPEIRDRLPLTAVEAALNLHYQDVPAPAVRYGLLCIPEPLNGALHVIEQSDIMAPRQFCNKLLQNCFLRPRLGKRLHIAEVTRGEPPHFRKLRSKVFCQTLDHLCSPTIFTLTDQNVFPYSPIEKNELLVHSLCCPHLRRPNLALQTG